MSRSILLIGGTGFLGSALRGVCAQDPALAVSFSSTSGGAGDARHVAIDLLDPSTLGVLRDFDVVVNLTGQVPVRPADRMDGCLALNDTGIRNLTGALGAGQFLVQISTTQVYGTARSADESSPLQPESPYAQAKAGAEFLLREGVPPDRLLILRLCNLYGPGQAKGLPWYLLDCIRNGRTIAIADNDGTLTRHFLHVEDAAQLIHGLIARRATGIINVAGPERYSIRDLVALCEKILGRPLSASYGDAQPKGTIGILSTARLRAILVPRYRHTLEQYFRGQFR